MRLIATQNKRRELLGDVQGMLETRDARGTSMGELGDSIQDGEGNLYWMWGWSLFGGTTRPKLVLDVFGGDGTALAGVVAYVSSGDGMDGAIPRDR